MILYFLPFILALLTLQTSFAQGDESQAPEQSIAITVPTKKKLSVRDKRLHKRSSKRVTMRDMTFEQLQTQKDLKIKNNELDLAIRYVEKMLPICKDMHQIGDITLERGDLYFKLVNYEKASKIYTDFTKEYPGNKRIEHGYYRAIICSFQCMLEPTRDQTKTKETLDLTHRFLERVDIFSEHVEHVKEIQVKCCERLAQSELAIAQFYLNQSTPNFKAAQNRLNSIKKDLLKAQQDSLQDIEKQVIVHEIEIAQGQHNAELATLKLAELNQKFPTGSSMVLAQAKPKRSFIDVF